MYGIVIWGSNVNLCEKNKINNILKSAFRAGFMDKKIDFTELLNDREIHILRNLENNNYNGLQDIFNLRNQSGNTISRHKYIVPPIKYCNFRNTYAVRVLFKK
jgi:hypothetical protein